MKKLFMWWLRRRLSPRPYPAEKVLRYLRWYPPFLAQGIVPLSISDDFSTAYVKIRKSLLNYNLNGAIFGGTILSAVDPWYGVLLWQKCLHEGIPLEVWVERLEIQFLRAGRGDMYLTCHIAPAVWAEIRTALLTEGKLRHTFSYVVYGVDGEVCAEGTQTLYLRNLRLRPRKKAS